MTFNLFVREIFRESLRSKVDKSQPKLLSWVKKKKIDCEANGKAFLADERDREGLAICWTVIKKQETEHGENK